MDLLKTPGKHSKLSELAYIVLNVGLVIILLVMVLSVQNIWLPIGLVLLSKWRVFAVRPRYWPANILSNLIDTTVGVGHVILLGAAQGNLWLQVGQSVGYAVWLLLIKPRSKRQFVSAQALAALFVGTAALSMVAYEASAIVYVIAMWVLGYVCARHILIAYEPGLTGLLSLVGALICAEFGWLGYQWMFAYQMPGSEHLRLVQLAFIVTSIGYVFERALASYHKHQRIAQADMVMPIIFSASLIAVLLIFFNRLGVGGVL
ncbi:hypothetical protein CR983_01055 [Candidatus Saccharibacteria bacterium]|nr:MAG: hypothetical protein CR983_01055 [Candidatus Saccharibacteria bacterium]